MLNFETSYDDKPFHIVQENVIKNFLFLNFFSIEILFCLLNQVSKHCMS